MQKFAKHVAEGLVRVLPLPIRSRRAALPCPCSAPGMAAHKQMADVATLQLAAQIPGMTVEDLPPSSRSVPKPIRSCVRDMVNTLVEREKQAHRMEADARRRREDARRKEAARRQFEYAPPHPSGSRLPSSAGFLTGSGGCGCRQRKAAMQSTMMLELEPPGEPPPRGR